jgi:nucleoside-diphosphate-sugar epimerase
MRRLMVTGGSGFIGTNLVEACRSADATEVINFDVVAPRCDEHATEWVQGDLLDSAALATCMQEFQPTHLVHLAARTDLEGKSMDDYESNTTGVKSLLQASLAYGKLQRSIFASSRLVCDISEAPSSELDYYPPNYYGRSKVVGEQLVRGHEHAGSWLIVRPTSIWGPWFETPYRDFFLSLATGAYVNPGRERILKQFGYVGNTVFQLDRLLAALPAQVQGKTLYLADPEPLELRSFAALIRRQLGLKAPRSAPVPVLKLAAKIGDGLKALQVTEPPLTSFRLANLRTNMLFDLAELSSVVGTVPYTVAQGVERTLEYMKSVGLVRAGSVKRPADRRSKK